MSVGTALPPATHRLDRRVMRIFELVETDFSLTVGAIAKALNLSTSRLEHLFKATTGHSLRAFLTRKRLERSLYLLSRTELSIKEIAFTTGFRHLANFTRAFRREYGLTPTAYRSSLGY